MGVIGNLKKVKIGQVRCVEPAETRVERCANPLREVKT